LYCCFTSVNEETKRKKEAVWKKQTHFQIRCEWFKFLKLSWSKFFPPSLQNKDPRVILPTSQSQLDVLNVSSDLPRIIFDTAERQVFPAAIKAERFLQLSECKFIDDKNTVELILLPQIEGENISISYCKFPDFSFRYL
jgi:hypothetical protein